MKLSRTTRVVAATLVAVGLAAATPSIAFAKGADNPATHNVNDNRGGHGLDNPQPHA